MKWCEEGEVAILRPVNEMRNVIGYQDYITYVMI